MKINFWSKNGKDIVNEKLKIKEITDDLIVSKNGDVSAVVKIAPFSIEMPSQQRSVKIVKFRKFLEQIDMPLQIIARTVNSQISDRIMIFRAEAEHRFKQIENSEDLRNNLNEFCDWLNSYGEKNCRPERHFYLVVKTVPNDDSGRLIEKRQDFYRSLTNEKAKKVVECANKFVHARRLTGKELQNLFHSYYYFSLYDNRKSEFLDIKRLIDLRRAE